MRPVPYAKFSIDTTSTPGTSEFTLQWESVSSPNDTVSLSQEVGKFHINDNMGEMTLVSPGLWLICLTVSWLPVTSVGTYGYAAIQADPAGTSTFTSVAEEAWAPITTSVTHTLNTHVTLNLPAGAQIRARTRHSSSAGSLRGSDLGHDYTFMTVTWLDKYHDTSI